MSAAPDTAGLATPPDPQPDPASTPAPERIAEILHIVCILAEYGRHLRNTIEHRAIWRGVATIAQFFGTATISVIIPHIHRGIMRAVALQRVLLQRARRGRDLVILAPRVHATRAAQPTASPSPQPEAVPQPAETPAAPEPARPPPHRSGPDEPLTLDTLPSMAQLEAEARRRPVGRTIVAICRDLGISPSLCAGPFWNRVFMAIRDYRGSLGDIVMEMNRREKRFDKENWRHPNLSLPEQTREAVRRVLGFFIGEPPVDPFRPAPAPGAPVAAVATGPP